MPYKPRKPCAHPGCAALIPPDEKYCDEHKPLHRGEDHRPSAGAYNNARWKRLRKSFLATHPLCEECMKAGRYVKATDVDHIIPHRGDLDLMWDVNNLQALCHSCHSIKTNREDMNPTYGY